MPTYNVLEKGFMHGRLYDPNGNRNKLVTDKPLKPIPPWLELVVETKVQRRTAESATAKKKVATSVAKKSKPSKANKTNKTG